MALNIKDEQTDRLARELARCTGEPITTATRVAIEERLERLQARRARPDSHAELAQIVQRGRTRAVLDSRPEAEILGYDADGLPG